MTEKLEIVLSLISHTNTGKTSLARTLLRKDVGVVLDGAHVTDESSRHVILESGNDSLVLWDTPGFGHVGKLLKKLKREKGLWGWLMNEVVDRVFDRAGYCSLEAVRNVREHSDVVLYLVNVQESPHDAGYVFMEFQLLETLGKPVVLVLNQVHEEQITNKAIIQRLKNDWRRHLKEFSCLQDVVVLDAFMRNWHHEIHLLGVVEPLLPDNKRAAITGLRCNYMRQQEEILNHCGAEAYRVFCYAKSQSQTFSVEEDPADKFKAMVSDLQNRLDIYVEELVEKHGIESDGRAKLLADLKQANGLDVKHLDEKKTSLMTGAITGAGSGLMADIMTGGLTFGGGAILGFLGGCLSGLSISKLNNMRKSGPITWKDDALSELFKVLVGYYLLAAHHGRGKGKLSLDSHDIFMSPKLGQFWQDIDVTIRKISYRLDSSKNSFYAPHQEEIVDLFKQKVNKALLAIYELK